jgi:propanol-preferring alcohol dehydrogenase
MRAMLLTRLRPLAADAPPLEAAEVALPEPGEGEVRMRISVCGVCHTELDEIEGRAPPPRLPVVPGHQVVGTVEAAGPGVRGLRPGERVGVAWIFSACDRCERCRRGDENLCPRFRATGRDADGGYAEYMTVPEAFAHPVPSALPDAEAAPLLCAGAIGYRSLRLARLEDGQRLGLMGFGASAHLVLKMVRHRYPGASVFVFSRTPAERSFALELGAAWAGDVGERPPEPLDRVIDTTPAWRPVLEALAVLAPGGRLVINALRKEASDQEELLRLDYGEHLWMEKEVQSVANVARRDVREVLALAAEVPIRPEVEEFPLAEANRALLELKARKIRGAKVLRIG